MTPAQEKALWTSFRKGEEPAFQRLMQVYYKLLFNYGTKLTKDVEFVRDCLQDLFLELWKNHRTLGETESVRAYLLKSFRRKLYRQLAKNKWRTHTANLEDEYDFEVVFSVENLIIHEQQQADLTEKITHFLNQLPRRQKEILYLRFYQELDISQIVEIMDISTQSAYNLLHKALQRMKQLLLDESLFCILLFAYAFINSHKTGISQIN